MTIFSFAIKRTIRSKLDMFMLLLIPVILVFISEQAWMPFPLGLQIYGIMTLFLSSKVCRVMMLDRENKMLVRIQAAPVSHLRYQVENVCAYALIIFSINLVVTVLAFFYYDYSLMLIFQLFMLYNLFSYTAIGMSMAWYTFFKNSETAFSILGGLFIAIAMLGGLLWPYEIMPEAMHQVIQLLPTYWLMVGFRQLFIADYPGNVLETLFILLLFGLIFIIFGSRRRLS